MEYSDIDDRQGYPVSSKGKSGNEEQF